MKNEYIDTIGTNLLTIRDEAQELAQDALGTGTAVKCDRFATLADEAATALRKHQDAKAGRVSHEEMVNRTFLKSPLVLFQVKSPQVTEEMQRLADIIGNSESVYEEAEVEEAKRSISVLEEVWHTERVFLDDDDAKKWIEPQRHRFPTEEEGHTFRLYAVNANGQLADIVREARP